MKKLVFHNVLLVEDKIEKGFFSKIDPEIKEEIFEKPVGTGVKEITLFNFEKEVSLEKAVSEIKNHGYSPVNSWQLLAFSMNKPDFQVEIPIISLESIYVKKEFMFGLKFLGRRGDFILNLNPLNFDLNEELWIAGVRPQ